MVDPDGKDNVAVTGGEYDSDNRFKYNFVEPSIAKLEEYSTAEGDENLYWVVMNAGYSSRDLRNFERIADLNNAEFVLLDSADELVGFLNSMGSDERAESNPVSNMATFLHGTPGRISFAFDQRGIGNEFTFGEGQIERLVVRCLRALAVIRENRKT